MVIKFNEYIENKKKKNIVLIIGSPRNPDCCPDEKSKTHQIAERLQKEFGNKVNFNLVDLAVKCDNINVLPCKGCVSTSAFHCHWPCDCYSKESNPKDLMYQEDVYKKLENCDAFFVITPIHWSSVSAVVKSLFDRLVCCSLTMTVSEAEKLLDEDIKNSKKTRKLEQDNEHNHLLKNHLEGKYAGFFAHGNNGGSDYREFSKKKLKDLPVLPDVAKEYDNKHGEHDVSHILEPLARQCVYCGINVPDNCVKTEINGFGIDYSEVNDLYKNGELYNACKNIFQNLLNCLI